MRDCKALRQVRQRQHTGNHCPPKPRKPSRFSALAFAAACALAACGPRDASFDPSNFRVHAQIAPRDVAVPSGSWDESSEFNGLYTEGSGILSCCWLAPHASLLVRKHGPAKTLVAGFWVPAVPRFDAGQQVTVAFRGSGARPVTTQLDSGTHYMLKFPVPPSVQKRTGLIPIDITSAVEFVPARDTPQEFSWFTFLHLRAPTSNTDVRHLGVVLVYLYFQ
jgi:hypothetical protein